MSHNLHSARNRFDPTLSQWRARTVAMAGALALYALFPAVVRGSDGAAQAGETHVCAHDDHQLRKLVLKDGSYDLITTCDVRGGRVQFVSAERDQRESMPASWVDWNASAELDRSALADPPAVTRDEMNLSGNGISAAESALPLAESAADQLPEDGTVFLVESGGANPAPREIVAAAAKVSRAASVASPEALFFGRARQFLVLEGRSARIASRSSRPDVYVRLSDAPTVASAQRSHEPAPAFALVHLETRGNDRVVSARERHWFTTKDKFDRIATMYERVGSDWLKLSPVQDLLPGEYAIVETLGTSLGTDIWDFRVGGDK